MQGAHENREDGGRANLWPIAWIIGFGGLALAGYGFGWAGFEDAPVWAVIGGFAAAFLIMMLFGLVGESVIEDGVKLVIVAAAAWAAPDIAWLNPIMAGLVFGALGAFAGNFFGRLVDRNPRRANTTRRKSKAERRREEDEERRKRNRHERERYESGIKAGGESGEKNSR